MHVSPVAQRGVVALMAVLFLLFMLGVVLMLAHQMAATDVHDSGVQNRSVEAVFLAESGLERARRRFFDGTACTALGVDGPHNLGQGSFTVNSGATTDFDGVTVLPVNQCRVQVTGRITATNVARTIEGIIQMGAKVQKGFFQKNTGTGNQTITGVGFQPRAVIFFWTRQTAAGYVANESMGFGFAAGGNQRSVGIVSDDNAGSSDFKRNRSAADVIMVLVPNSSTNNTINNGARASFTSFNADGFQINWGDNDGRADIIHYIALGGDITNAFVGSFNARTSVGNTAVTGVGFQPDAVLFLNSTIIATASESDRTVYNGKQFNLGMMNSTGQQWAISACGRDGSGSTPHSLGQQRTDQVMVTLTGTCTTTADSAASYSSMNADGFTINWSNGAGVAFPIYYLALRGGQHQLGSFNQATGAGNQQTTGVGFEPDGLFLASFGRVASTTLAADSEVSLGAASGITARGAIWSETRNVDPTDANTSTVTNRVIRLATSQTTDAEADLVSFDSAGFTLNWTPVDGTARQLLYWAAGSGVPVVRWRELP